ncbi:RagB/SusD family nutrient uptake outer membrane protein [Pedobacter panaciterrae]|jgi:SusD family.|uniref:RagB/SusD family nutrient uptake outer membrane protein n=1 Tax=Pedobacter panaciterrae TaxID=363849 RepID=A0ABU8NHL9_9SPHI|nr:RagB/SusD family nutrient uptake outer membrane protein [Pedobacter panaciterrae]NQX57037.1 RagB/SusD family nutrient uptake outer membrane protein [Pedobacter panaciterrae]
MKNIYIILACFCLAVTGGCKKALIEEPHSTLTPDFFSTAQGFQKGLDAAYAGTRSFWGNQNLFTMTVIGTDEFYTGKDGNNNINKYNSNYNTENGTVSAIWKDCYVNINTCNGVIDNAVKVTGVADDLKNRIVAEAKFLRANYYFILVQFWGDVTLNKNFQSTPTTSASRQPLAEVYDFIVQDLKDVLAEPTLFAGPKSSGALPGQANKAAAMHLLAKVYLTRAGSSAKKADDYTNAYTSAMQVINTSGATLLPDFASVYAEGNENSNEVLWTVQHTSNLAYNGPNNSGGADNVLNHMWVPQYELRPGMKRDVFYGRPYIRCVPTAWLTNEAFAERVNDTRYAKTFQTVWLCNNAASIPKWENPLPPGAPANAVVGQPKFALGDTAIFMPGYDVSDAKIAASRYLLIPPRKYDNTLSPYMKKYNDTKRADLNYPSIRPVIVYRLAETHLIAAEAAFMGGAAASEAVNHINIIRRRAAFPNPNPSVMDVASIPSLDFILDERSRELCGENVRWWDLVRTGKLIDRVKTKNYNPEAGANIMDFHVLRPIPQDQIDATTTGPKYPQNPGWF